MIEQFGIVGIFKGRRYEDREVLREMEKNDPVGEMKARINAVKKAMFGELPKDFELVESFEHSNTIALAWYDLVFDTMVKGDSYTANIRMGVFGNDVTPTDALTISTFRATLGEATGYTVDSGNSTNRSTTTFASSSSQSITNTAAPSRFTFTGTDTIYGGFLVQGATLKDGSGDSSPAVYVAGAKFSAAQPVSNGSIIDLDYTQSKP